MILKYLWKWEKEKMQKMRKSIGLVLVLWWTATLPAEALWVDPGPEQIQEAIRWGKANLEERKAKGLEIDGEDAEWEVNLGEGKGKGRVYLQSPFAMISFEARKYAAIQMEVPSWQIDSILLQTKGKLLMSIALYGKERYFARKYRVFLEADGKRIEPNWVDVHRGVSYGLDDSEAPLRAAYNVAFPLEKINPNSLVTLIAVDPQGNETRFPFDLSKMR